MVQNEHSELSVFVTLLFSVLFNHLADERNKERNAERREKMDVRMGIKEVPFSSITLVTYTHTAILLLLFPSTIVGVRIFV